MKKIWAVLVISICLMVSFPISVLAETNRITAYIDAYAVGTWTYDDDYGREDGTLDGVIMGINIPISKFKIGFEYEDISYETYLSDTSTSIAKGGFQVFGNDKVRVDLTLNYFEREYEVSKGSVSGLLFGVDGLWNISDRMFLQGSLGLSLDGKAEYESYEEDAFIILEKIKYNYMFTDNFGLGLGFNFISILFDDEDFTTIDTGGFTAGITVRF